MAQSFNTDVATYKIKGKIIRVYACYDDYRDFESGKTPDFYDVYEDNGQFQVCINEGDPYYELPTLFELEDLIDTL